jgi:hypothetical protein
MNNQEIYRSAGHMKPKPLLYIPVLSHPFFVTMYLYSILLSFFKKSICVYHKSRRRVVDRVEARAAHRGSDLAYSNSEEFLRVFSFSYLFIHALSCSFSNAVPVHCLPRL